MDHLDDLVPSAREGSLEAYGRLVQLTRRMALGVALRVLRDGFIHGITSYCQSRVD